MKFHTVALVTWAAFVIVSSEHNIANLNNEKVVYIDLPAKQIVQPYVTNVEARNSKLTDNEDHPDDFAGLSRPAVHAEEKESDGVPTASDASAPNIRLESTDKYPFREYSSQESGYTEDVLEYVGDFGRRVQDHSRDEALRGDSRKNDVSFQKSTPPPFRNKDDRSKKFHVPATREPFVFALKEESDLAENPPSDSIEVIKSDTFVRNSDEIFSEVTTENSPLGDTSILENDVVSEILPTPQARLSRPDNDTANKKTSEKSTKSAKKPESTVEIIPSFRARFSSPIVVADLPNRETQETVVDYMDDAFETYKTVEDAEITSKIDAEISKVAASDITSPIMLNPLQVGITLMNSNHANLTDNEQSSLDIDDYPQDDLQRLATIDKEYVKNQSHIDYQNESYERDEVEKRVEVDIQKVPDDSVEIQKSIEIYHTAPVHEIHYPPEYIHQTTNLGVIETNNIGNLQKPKQPYNQIEQSELRSNYDIYQGNDQDEQRVIKTHAFPQNFNRHEYNVLEDDVGRPMASTVSAEYSSNPREQTSEVQPFKYNDMQSVLASNQFDDTFYDQSNVRHNLNDNGVQTKPAETSTKQETSQHVKQYAPYSHQHPIRSPEIRRPEVSQLLLKIIPEGSSANNGFLVPIPRPYPIVPYPVHLPVEKPIRLPHTYPLQVEKRVPYTVQRLVVQPPSYPLHTRLPAAYTATYTTVPVEKVTEKPAVSSRPYRAERPPDTNGPVETRFTKYYQEATTFGGENTNLHGGLTFVPQSSQSETNVSQFYNIPYSKPSAYNYNIDVGKNFVPTAHFSDVKLVILPKKFGSHVILRPHAPSYAIPSFGRQVLYNLVEKDKTVKDEYVGPTPPRKTSQNKAFSQIKSQFSANSAHSLGVPRKSRQPETQRYGSFRQSKMEYGFKPPMIPSIQYDENTASKIEN